MFFCVNFRIFDHSKRQALLLVMKTHCQRGARWQIKGHCSDIDASIPFRLARGKVGL